MSQRQHEANDNMWVFRDRKTKSRQHRCRVQFISYILFFYQKKKINKNTYFYYHQLIARGEPQKRIYYDEGSADVSASEWMSWHSGMAEKIERAKKTARLSILFVLVAYNDSLSRTSIDSRRRLLINRLVNLMNAREKRKSKKGEKKRSEKFWRMGWERW